MANNSCVGEIARSIKPDCVNPIVTGYTGRAIILPYSEPTLAVARDAINNRIVTALNSDKVIAVENAVTAPFTGSNTASNGDSGKIEFTKQVMFRIPLRGAAVSKEIVEPLATSTQGYLVVVEKKDKVGDGSFEVIGLQSACQVTADGITRNDTENGGEIMVTMATTESYFECVFLDETYAKTLPKFNELYESAI